MAPKDFTTPGSLMLETQRLVKAQNLLKLYNETGINLYWLRKFAAGQFSNPSVNRVQALYEKLSGKNLVV